MKEAIKDLYSIFFSNREAARLLILMTLIMLVFEYYGWQKPFYFHIAPNLSLPDMFKMKTFYAQVWTTLSFLTLMVFIPLIENKFTGKSLKEVGLGFNFSKKNVVPYLVLAIFMTPFLIAAASQESFNKFYPLYRPREISDWLSFELIYGFQFLAVEFFFRGYGLFRLEKLYGKTAIFMMTLPYALIHIHKPFPEAIGSVFAGIALGYLSLKGRSIWPGVALHLYIAWVTDFLSLSFSGWF